MNANANCCACKRAPAPCTRRMRISRQSKRPAGHHIKPAGLLLSFPINGNRTSCKEHASTLDRHKERSNMIYAIFAPLLLAVGASAQQWAQLATHRRRPHQPHLRPHRRRIPRQAPRPLHHSNADRPALRAVPTQRPDPRSRLRPRLQFGYHSPTASPRRRRRPFARHDRFRSV